MAEPGVDPGSGAGGPPKVVTDVLDPVLAPLGFAPGQIGDGATTAQVIFCRGEIESPDGGCVDLIIDFEAKSDWRITDVRYWGFTADRWHLEFNREVSLADQLASLARSLPGELA